VRYISHLDVLRAWERAIRRAELPLSYSQGFTPHPKLAFASPLPLGFIGEAEVMDVTLDERVEAREFRDKLLAQSSADLGAFAMEEVAPTAPPPQAGLLWADYRLTLSNVNAVEVEAATKGFLELAEFSWTEERREKSKTYDMRSAVAWLTTRASECGGAELHMRLQADAELTARPEQVVEALFPGAEMGVISRTGLVLGDSSPAREAWRRRGQYQE